MNEQNIDTDRLAAEADRIAAGLPPDLELVSDQPAGEGAPGALASGDPNPNQVAELAAGAEPFAHMVVDTACDIFAPNWQVTLEERDRLSKAIALAAVYWFPGEIHPKYLALIGVAGVAWSVAQARKDPATGELRPMKVRAAPTPVRTDDASAAAA